MTLFEYLAGGYWVHVSWLLAGLGMGLVTFWAFWTFHDGEWTLFRFVGSLPIPLLLNYAHIGINAIGLAHVLASPADLPGADSPARLHALNGILKLS